MKSIKTVALSDKGALKPAVRKAINESMLPQLAEVLGDLGFEYIADKKAFALPYADVNGNIVYLSLTSSVGLVSPADKAAKKASPKAPKESPVVEIEG